MKHRRTPSRVPTHRVDWSNPLLESLLQKTESWQIDNRGSFPPQDVEIHVGWGAGVSKPAALVWERANVMVLETAFTIAPGEHVRVDRPYGDELQSRWGSVVESRAGNRAGDAEGNIHVHWLHMR